MNNEIKNVEEIATQLQNNLKSLLDSIGDVSIGNSTQFPFGWRKAAKGRTVWRLLEEVISQNLESKALEIGLSNYAPAASEVGVYDFEYQTPNGSKVFVNIKSAVEGGRTNKDDISKATALHSFLSENNPCCLLVATIEIEFKENPMSISLNNCYVVPVTWLPDVYVNPSNNGNLQSSKYKYIDKAQPRTTDEFITELEAEMAVAAEKRRVKAAR